MTMEPRQSDSVADAAPLAAAIEAAYARWTEHGQRYDVALELGGPAAPGLLMRTARELHDNALLWHPNDRDAAYRTSDVLMVGILIGRALAEAK